MVARRTDASRIGGVGLQIIRLGAALQRPRTGRASISPGAPSKLNADHRRALAEVVEAGPVPAVDGVVRWRRKDLARWLLETFATSLDETTVGREFARLRQDLGAAAIRARSWMRNFPAELEDPGEAPERLRGGGKMKPASARRISSHAEPDVARARGATSAPNGPISSARSVPRKAPGWSCPGATPRHGGAPCRRRSRRPGGAIVDQAGWS